MSGKTSVLEGLSIGIGSFMLGIDNVNTHHIQKDDIRLLSLGKNTEFQLPVVIWAEGIVDTQRMHWGRTLTKLKGRTTYSNAKNIKGIASKLQTSVRKGDNVQLPLIAYFPVDSVWKDGEIEKMDLFELGSRFRGYDNALNATYNYNNFAKWFKTIQLSHSQHGEFEAELQTINLAVTNCIESCKKVYFDYNLREVVMELDDGRRIPFTRLSSGFKKMMAIITDLAFRCITLNPHLKGAVLEKTEGVVLIDEIDSHLHPSWQRKIVGALKQTFPLVQFIVTTHSPQIVASAAQGEVIVLPEYDDESSPKKVIPLEESFQGWQLDYILKDVLDSPVSSNELDLNPLLSKLDKALEENTPEVYHQALKQLEKILHPNDSILKVYQLKLATFPTADD